MARVRYIGFSFSHLGLGPGLPMNGLREYRCLPNGGTASDWSCR